MDDDSFCSSSFSYDNVDLIIESFNQFLIEKGDILRGTHLIASTNHKL